MQGVKSNKFSNLFSIIKCCLIGIVATLVGTVILAIILKFTDLSSNIINYINAVIKMIAIFITISCVKKVSSEKLFIKSIVAGLIYAVLSFIIFSILNGGFSFNLSILYDVLFALIVAIIVSVILNLFSRK